jgi:hypothetical protein
MAGTQRSETLEKGPISEHNEPIASEVLALEASQAAAAEHRMSLWQAIKTYPKAIGWSVLLSSTLIMGKISEANTRRCDSLVFYRGLRSRTSRQPLRLASFQREIRPLERREGEIPSLCSMAVWSLKWSPRGRDRRPHHRRLDHGSIWVENDNPGLPGHDDRNDLCSVLCAQHPSACCG